MAKTLARCIGYDINRSKKVQRLGSLASKAEANTWNTFTTCYVDKSGRGYIEVKRDGKTLHRFDFGPE